LTAYRKATGIYVRGQDYHSYRHTVITALLAAGVPLQHVEMVAGHQGQGMSAGRYLDAAKVPLRILHDAICKLDWSEISPLFAQRSMC
jgi:integrase